MVKLQVIVAFLMMSIGSYAQKLPGVSLKDLDGKTVNMSAYNNSDKPVIISFWATWCGPCLKELTAINEVYSKWQKETGVELVAVSIDDARTKSRVKPQVKGKSWKYKVVLDENQELKRALNVGNVPYTMVLYKGKVVYSHSSYTPGIENEIYKHVKAAVGK